ncbi:molybdopterin-guanine dinucleotide biosynthesis protein B [Shouchella sp. 1P09AA]|uniref:molybdopterin-guanine dinucleotide biosynthesis protein B n=1 Tax=unclassified Shouchella TaxID=2893065 RepID=UPI0039A1D7BD
MGKILQVVGYKNAGKTTFIERLLVAFQQTPQTVATIKHHGHGGEPDGMTDSARFMQKGSASSIVEGAGVVHLSTNAINPSLTHLINVQTYLCRPDIIFIEGWKQETYPKVVCLRDETDLALLSLNNICCVLYHKLNAIENVPFPVFQRDDPAALTYIKEYIERSEGA